jgi:hypothetical protein
MRQLGLAVAQYVQNYDERFSKAEYPNPLPETG